MAAKKVAEKATPSYVLVRSHLAGVFVGEQIGEATQDRVVLKNARRIYSWAGALSVDTIARKGVAPGSKLTGPHDVTVYGQILQINPLSEEARAKLYAQPVSQ